MQGSNEIINIDINNNDNVEMNNNILEISQISANSDQPNN